MAILKHLVVPKTARYYQSKEINKNTENIWLVLHGYGHLAEYFIRKFDVLSNDTSVVIAPEGFHRFYLQGVSGRVGASWMTKEDRENDIKDYVSYLNILIENIMNNCNGEVKINLIGFSQGGATASRYAMCANFKINLFVLLCSVFPPDLNFNPVQINNLGKLVAIMGDNDEYVSINEFTENINEWKLNGLSVQSIIFNGKHEVSSEVLQIIKQLA